MTSREETGVLDASVNRIPEPLWLGFSYARFIALHLLCLAAIWTGVPRAALKSG